MATTQKDNVEAAAEFGAAFAEDQQQAAPGGMDADGMDPEAYEAMDEIMDEPEAEAEPADDEPTDPKEVQRQKSWEGRLRAREAELKAREDAMRGGKEQAPGAEDGSAVDDGDPASPADAVEGAIESVQSGEMTAAEAMASLSADFGDEFAKLLGVLIESKSKEMASSIADQRVGAVKQSVDDIVAGIHDERVQRHFETIVEAHPDFLEIAESESLQSYLEGLPESERAAAQQTIDKGNAKSIVKLLDAVKAQGGKSQASDEDAMDAAEGVRSSRSTIPEKPSQSDDFGKAWDEF